MIKKGKGSPEESAAQLCDQINRKYIAPLARDLLKLAKMTGGQDVKFIVAKNRLNDVLQYVKDKRG